MRKLIITRSLPFYIEISTFLVVLIVSIALFSPLHLKV